MTYLLTIVLCTINMIYSFCKKHNKIMAFLLMSFAWVLYWGNTSNPDYEVYSQIYYSNANAITNNMEIGYISLIKTANFIGLSYEFFLLIISLFGFLLIHSTVKKYTENYNYIYILYFIFPYFFDIVQIRNFLIMAIFIYSTKYIFSNSRIKYCIIILLAGLIHISAFLYLPMLLIQVKKKNNLIRLIVFFSFIFSLIIITNNKNIPLLNEIILLLKINKINYYLTTKTNYGFILFWILQILSFIVIYISKRVYRKYESKEFISNNNRNIINVIYWINIIAFIYFPIYLINVNFTRLMRNIVPLNYLAIIITNEEINDRCEKIIYNLFVFIYVLTMFLSQMLQYKDTIIKTVLENNIIF